MANVDILKLKSYVFKGIQCNVITVANRSPPLAISDLHAPLYWGGISYLSFSTPPLPHGMSLLCNVFFFLPKSLSLISIQLRNIWIHIRFLKISFDHKALSVKIISSIELPL